MVDPLIEEAHRKLAWEWLNDMERTPHAEVQQADRVSAQDLSGMPLHQTAQICTAWKDANEAKQAEIAAAAKASSESPIQFYIWNISAA